MTLQVLYVPNPMLSASNEITRLAYSNIPWNSARTGHGTYLVWREDTGATVVFRAEQHEV